MTEVDAGLLLEVLKRIQGDVSDIKQEMRDLKVRVGIVEGHMQSMIAAQHLTNERLDRMDDRIGRIERRLDLVEAH